MGQGSYGGGIVGGIGGVLLALLAIFIGSSVARSMGAHHDAPAAHGTEH